MMGCDDGVWGFVVSVSKKFGDVNYLDL